MKTPGILWLVGSLMLAGCVHTKEIRYWELESFQEEMVESMTGEEVKVNLRSGETVQGEALTLTADTLWLHLAQSDSTLHLSMGEVKSIETSPTAAGPILGVLAGGAVGAGIGALIGDAMDSRQSSRGFGPSAAEVVAMMGGVVGVVTGVIVGANATSGQRFVLPEGGTPATRPQEAIPTEYVRVIVNRILEETETSITIRRGDRNVTLPKSEIRITRTKDGIEIKLPRELWYGTK
jgi:hypothetical protein